MRQWTKSKVPRKGWSCVDVIDIRPNDEPIPKDEYETCEMCGNHPIRYVHVMEHDEYEEPLNVGCVCAERMSDDYVNPKSREKRLKSRATRRRNWLSLKWKTSKKGNPYLKKDGMILTVFADQFRPGMWGYGVGGDFSVEKYDSQDAAKLALFEEYFERLTGD
jgi:hypothetical protein